MTPGSIGKYLLAGGIVMALGMSQQAVATDADILRALKAQMKEMQAQIEALEKRLEGQEKEQATLSESVVETREKVDKSEQRDEKTARAAQLYGQARVSVDHRSGGGWGNNDGTEVVSNASRLGVQGEVDSTLPDTDLFYRLEFRYETADFVNGGPGSDTDTKQFEFREGYAGLKGDRGTARLGRLATEYKKTMTTIDPWNDNAPQADSGGRQGASELHAGYANNAVDYVTPVFYGGLTGNGWYSTRFDNSNKPIDNTSTLKNFRGGEMWGLGAKWKSGPHLLAADYISIDADESRLSQLSNGDGWQIAGRHSGLGPFSVAAMYEDVEDIGLGKNFLVNGIYTIREFRIIGTYGQNRDARVYGMDDWNNGSLGIKYDLTKNSELLAAWNHLWDSTNNDDFDTFTIGVNAKFGY
jgi:uncharacterized coiled-coil protein SlyX